MFADFYEELYQKRDGEAGYPEMEPQTFTPIDVEEVRGQAKLMANRKSADSRGVVAELLKHSSDEFSEVVVKLFNDVLKTDPRGPRQTQGQ